MPTLIVDAPLSRMMVTIVVLTNFFLERRGDRENFIDPACYLSESVMCIGIWTLEHPDYAL